MNGTADGTPASRPAPGDGDRSGLARALFPTGDEPDPRFTLANERTFLAWMRTALAFIAGGVALEALPMDTVPVELRNAGALVALCLGILLAAGAAFRWLRVERAMREQRPLPAPAIVPVLSVGALLVAVVLLVLVLL
ncbi:DUF202 domain-containing protein [Corynebacterium sp. USCH3]|uniref:YidH family protein n=1 Tax=Corynebacterium sp. USCH3 TaxID=3024840 RepID=UPI0030A1DC27